MQELSHPKLDHIRALDGLRGVAILLVLCHHLVFMNNNTGSLLIDLASNFAMSGWIGVDLFFVLSGFLITRILLSTRDSPHYFRNFYMRRVLRIFPLYYAVMLLLAVLTVPLHFQWHGLLPWYFLYIANWFTPAPLLDVPSSRFHIAHLWSLQVEEQFYFFWPFLVFRIRSMRTFFASALGVCLVSAGLRIIVAVEGWDSGWAYFFTLSRLDALALGGIVAALWSSSFQGTLRKVAPWTLAASSAPLLFVGYRNPGMPHDSVPVYGYGISLLAMAFSSLLAVTLSGGLWSRLFRLHILRFFGKYSYGIYMFHFVLADLFLLKLHAVFHSRAGAVAVPALIVGGASVAMAYVSYHLYEKRFLHLKRYFA